MSYQEPLGPPGARVTRNNPPKRVLVADNAMVVVNGKLFAGDSYPLEDWQESAGNEILVEGPVAEQLEAEGHATIIEWDATEDFNKSDDMEGTYEHADKHGTFSDVTTHRQNLGKQHLMENRAMQEDEA